jgi:hypothetical protein
LKPHTYMVENMVHRTSNLHLDWVAASNAKEWRGVMGSGRRRCCWPLPAPGSPLPAPAPLPSAASWPRQQPLQLGLVAAQRIGIHLGPATPNLIIPSSSIAGATTRAPLPSDPEQGAEKRRDTGVAKEREINCRKLGFDPRFYMVKNGSMGHMDSVGPQIFFLKQAEIKSLVWAFTEPSSRTKF